MCVYMDVNLVAVLTATVLAFMVGGIWYSPYLFGALWKKEEGITQKSHKKRHPAIVYIAAFLLAFVTAFGLDLFITSLTSTPTGLIGLKAGLGVGFYFVLTSFGINYLFADRSIKLFLIDAGYHLVKFALFGIVLGAWR